MATHSSILPWRITWTEEHGRLESMGLHREQLSMHASRWSENSVYKKWDKAVLTQERPKGLEMWCLPRSKTTTTTHLTSDHSTINSFYPVKVESVGSWLVTKSSSHLQPNLRMLNINKAFPKCPVRMATRVPWSEKLEKYNLVRITKMFNKVSLQNF